MIKRYLLLLLSDWAISVESGLNKKAWPEMMKTPTFNFWFLGTEKKMDLRNEKLSHVCKFNSISLNLHKFGITKKKV